MQVAGDFTELVFGNALGHALGKAGQTRQDPRIGGRRGNGLARREALEIAEHEAARIPDLRDESTRLLGARRRNELVGFGVDVGIEAHVLVVRNQREQVEAHGIGAVFRDEVHGVDAVALRFGHAAAVFRQNGGVNHDVMERNLAQEVR